MVKINNIEEVIVNAQHNKYFNEQTQNYVSLGKWARMWRRIFRCCGVDSSITECMKISLKVVEKEIDGNNPIHLDDAFKTSIMDQWKDRTAIRQWSANNRVFNNLKIANAIVKIRDICKMEKIQSKNKELVAKNKALKAENATLSEKIGDPNIKPNIKPDPSLVENGKNAKGAKSDDKGISDDDASVEFLKQIQTLENETQKLENQNKKLNNELVNAHNIIKIDKEKHSQAALKAKNEETIALQKLGEMDKLIKTNIDLTARIKKLEAEVVPAPEGAGEAQHQELSDKIKLLEKERDDCREWVVKKNKSIEENNKNLVLFQQQVNYKDNENEKEKLLLQNQKSTLEKEKGDLQFKIDAADKQIEKLTKEVSRLKEKYNNLLDKNKVVVDESAKINTVFVKMREELNFLRSEHKKAAEDFAKKAEAAGVPGGPVIDDDSVKQQRTEVLQELERTNHIVRDLNQADFVIVGCDYSQNRGDGVGIEILKKISDKKIIEGKIRALLETGGACKAKEAYSENLTLAPVNNFNIYGLIDGINVLDRIDAKVLNKLEEETIPALVTELKKYHEKTGRKFTLEPDATVQQLIQFASEIALKEEIPDGFKKQLSIIQGWNKREKAGENASENDDLNGWQINSSLIEGLFKCFRGYLQNYADGILVLINRAMKKTDWTDKVAIVVDASIMHIVVGMFGEKCETRVAGVMPKKVQAQMRVFERILKNYYLCLEEIKKERIKNRGESLSEQQVITDMENLMQDDVFKVFPKEKFCKICKEACQGVLREILHARLT